MNSGFTEIKFSNHNYQIADISTLANIKKIPYSYRILAENVLRQKYQGQNEFADQQVEYIVNCKVGSPINFVPNRILSHDILGKVMLVDFLSYKEALEKKNINSQNIQPKIPIDIVIDHSLQVDFFGNTDSVIKNLQKEYNRNSERFSFLRWCSKNLKNVTVIPPGVGICHQVNIEYLSKVVWNDNNILHPDTCIGTDSHTPMVNAIGVLGWGVGGIEAEVAMLGKSLSVALPEVIGVHLKNKCLEGITSTDLVLTITELLRKHKVVGSFVEFFGEGVNSLSVGDRATISNMAPEYGSTAVLFPVDHLTLDYLRMTGRNEDQIKMIEEYSKSQHLWRDDRETPTYSRTIELDLSSVVPCVSGPKNPEDRLNLNDLSKSVNTHSENLYKRALRKDEIFKVEHSEDTIQDGDIMIAAITSCTNTSNPKGMIAAGLVAKNLIEKGITRNNRVKTSFAPGSQVTATILEKAGLQKYLDQLGFNVVGFGCTTCNGGSGPLQQDLANSIEKNKVFSVAVLSGNRNFQGRIHPNIRASYLASPALVICFSILGSVLKSLDTDSLGKDQNGKDVFLKDVWPSNEEIEQFVQQSYKPEFFISKYKEVSDGGDLWDNLEIPSTEKYEWSDQSTYFKKPPYLEQVSETLTIESNITNVRPLVLLGDSITTDHISPSNAITRGTAAGDYLESKGVKPEDFNNYTTRRAHHEVAMRATFANLRLRNKITPDKEGSVTIKYPEQKEMRIFEAAMEYKKQGITLAVFAGDNYGCGSSRDTAAKGPLLLGVKIIVAKSFERIHRSNLIGMGLLPLQFKQGQGIEELQIQGSDIFDFVNLDKISNDHKEIDLKIKKQTGDIISAKLDVRLDTPEEIDYWQNGGILPMAWREEVRK
jgi:aconitate hydratase